MLLLPSLAWSAKPSQISTSRKQPTQVWVLPGVAEFNTYSGSECDLPWRHQVTLPAGLPARAHLVNTDCKEPRVFLDLDVSVMAEPQAQYLVISLESVSLTAPKKNAWESVEPVAQAYIGGPSGSPTLALPVDGQGTEPYPLGYGDPVSVLDQRMAVIRTESGRELVMVGHQLQGEDPLQRMGKPGEQLLRTRFRAGRSTREGLGALASIPASEALLDPAQVGRSVVLRIDPRWLAQERFDAQWLDPVGQVLKHACGDTPKRFEPCGTYVLDYSPLGAWWPAQDGLIIGAVDGEEVVDGEQVPRLKILVRDPFSDSIAVSPGWDAP